MQHFPTTFSTDFFFQGLLSLQKQKVAMASTYILYIWLSGRFFPDIYQEYFWKSIFWNYIQPYEQFMVTELNQTSQIKTTLIATETNS